MALTSSYSGMSNPWAFMTSSRQPCFWMSFRPFLGPMPETPGLKSVPIMMQTSTSCSLVSPSSASMLGESITSVFTSR